MQTASWEVLNFQREIYNVASLTKKQWQCKEWYVHKRGFITASKAKNVYTMQIYAARQPETDVSVLVTVINSAERCISETKYPGRSKNPLDWGFKQEESARKAYYRLESSKHNQLNLISKGLMISKTKFTRPQFSHIGVYTYNVVWACSKKRLCF